MMASVMGNCRRKHRPYPGNRFDLQAAAELIHFRLHHVHPHPATGKVGDLHRGRKAGQQQQGQEFLVAHPGEFLREPQTLPDRLPLDRLAIDSPTVVADHNRDLIAQMPHHQRKATRPRLALGLPFVGPFDAVVATVPHQVCQGIGEYVEDALVQLQLRSRYIERDLLAQLAGQVANEPREFPEKVADGLHAGLQDRSLQLRGDGVEPLDDGTRQRLAAVERNAEPGSGPRPTLRPAS